MNLGKKGEEQAEQFLRKKGMTILQKNYRTLTGEIDLIAQDGDEIVFVEVKLRTNKKFGEPEEAVDMKKADQIRSVARQFISQYQLFGKDCRFDIISIKQEGKSVRLKHIKNAFY